MKRQTISGQFHWLAGAIAILVIIAHSPAVAVGRWEIVQEPEFRVNFTGVRFLSEDHGVLWGDKGHTVRTLNGGADWTLKQLGGGGPHSGTRATYFTDQSEGWVIYGDTVYHTPDGGRSWEEWQATFGDVGAERFFARDAYFLNGEEGWLSVDTGGFIYKLLHTSDGGKHWELGLDIQEELGGEPFSIHTRSVHFLDNMNGWVAVDVWLKNGRESAFVFHTSDGGQNWDVTTLAESDLWLAASNVYFLTPDVGWVSLSGPEAGLKGQLLHTTDGGQTWEKQMDMGLTKIYFLDDSEGWALSGMEILHTIDGGEIWEIQFEGKLSNSWLTDIYFINRNEGWAVGGFGTVLHTTNGGETWRHQTESIGAMRAVDFTNPQNGWAVGVGIMHTHNGALWTVADSLDGNSPNTCKDVDFVNTDVGWIISSNQIFHTTDSGLTWTLQFEDKTKAVLQAAYFANEDEGWVVCSTGEVMHTNDGGNTWEIQPAGAPQLADVSFVNPLHGWVAGQIGGSTLDGAVYGTQDGGKTWEKQKGNFTGIKGICFVNENEGWCGGWAGGLESKVYHTSNGGKRWELQATKSGFVNDVHFVSEDKGWLVGLSGLIYYTEDGGKSWIIQNSGTDDDLMDICYDGGTHIYAVGNWGTILRYTDPDLKAFGRSVEPSEKTLITSWGQVKNTLHQNYPNPCNPGTWIPYQLGLGSHVTINIYDISGKLVRTLGMGRREPGLYVNTQEAAYWNGKNQQGESVGSGVYFYQLLTNNGYSSTKKMLVVK